MATYVGDEKRKLKINGMTYRFQLPSDVTVINGSKLLSSEGYVLRDSNGIYLTVKDGE